MSVLQSGHSNVLSKSNSFVIVLSPFHQFHALSERSNITSFFLAFRTSKLSTQWWFLVHIISITTCLLQQSFAPMDQAVALPNWTPPSHFGLILARKSLCQTLFFSWLAHPPPPTCGLAFLSQHPLEVDSGFTQSHGWSHVTAFTPCFLIFYWPPVSTG